MKKSLVYIPLLFAFVFSCESINESGLTVEEYFPLEIGNRWYYNSELQPSSTIMVTREVIGKKVIDNKIYYEIEEKFQTIEKKDTLYYRANGDTLFSKKKNYAERIEADFSLQLNEASYWQKDLRVTRKNENGITFETPFGGDYGYKVTYRKGVGMTHMFINAWSYYYRDLIKAELK